MASYEVGDWRIAVLTVTGGDITTTAVLTVVKPDGTTATPAVTPSGGGVTHTAAGYELTTAGEWLERWVVTGTGKTTDRVQLLVAPDPTATPAGARVYATTTDYANVLLKAPPADSRRALREASAVVDEMLLTAVYEVDDDGVPTDPDVAAALRDATCYQAEAGRLNSDSNATGVPGGGIQSFTIGSVSVNRRASSSASTELKAHWSPAAYRRLAQAGLTNMEAWSY